MVWHCKLLDTPWKRSDVEKLENGGGEGDVGGETSFFPECAVVCVSLRHVSDEKLHAAMLYFRVSSSETQLARATRNRLNRFFSAQYSPSTTDGLPGAHRLKGTQTETEVK